MLALLLACACDSTDIVDSLDKARYLMSTRPDSSLSILENIDCSEISSMQNNALYALLYTQARDKNFFDDINDSLINIAVSYYEANPNNHIVNLFLSYYYQGRIRENNQLYESSILSYTKAEELIDSIEDYYLRGLLYSRIGIIYRKLYDYESSLKNYQSAFNCFQKGGKAFLEKCAICDIAQSYYYLHRYQDAEELFIELLDWSYQNGEKGLSQDCFNFLLLIYDGTGQNEKLNDLLRSKYYQFCGTSKLTLRILAYQYAKICDYEMSSKCMNTAWKISSTLNDTINIMYQQYRIDKLSGDYISAINYLEKVFRLEDSLVRYSLSQPHISIQRDYFRYKSDNSILQLKNKKLQLSILAGLLAFVIMLAIFVYVIIRGRLRARDNEICKFIDKIEGLNTSLFTKEDKITLLESEVDEMTGKINELYASEFKMIDKLCKTYYETHGVRKDKDAIYKQVKTEIEKLASDKNYIIQVEEYVNKYRGNIMALLRQELPMFSPMDYRFLCFFYAGFSAKAISVFTNDSINNIYVRKYRYRDRILKAGTKHCKMFLENLL